MNLEVAKEAIQYFSSVTGQNWSDFFEIAKRHDSWLANQLMLEIEESGVSLDELKANKDTIKAFFDEESRKNAGEFFTPEKFAKLGRDLISKYIPNWGSTHYAWEGSAGTGNLFRTSNHDVNKLFLSTLQEDDVNVLKNTPEFEGAHIWQLDFLNETDINDGSGNGLHFSEKLDPELRRVLENDEPLVIYMNPPYKMGSAKSTGVGNRMCSDYVSEETYQLTGEHTFSKSAYDLFNQFCWQVMNLVDTYNLTSTYYCFFGPLIYFTGLSSMVLFNEFEHRFEFIDGYCFSAQEFNGTSTTLNWGIGISLWKARGGAKFEPDVKYHKDVLLNKVYADLNGELVIENKVLYESPRERLSEWTKPKSDIFDAAELDKGEYVNFPVMTSFHTFKGGEPGEKTAYRVVPARADLMGTLMTDGVMIRSAGHSALLSTPTTIDFIPIVKENLWRSISNFAFRRCYMSDWVDSKKEISAPNENVEGYKEWLHNAVVIFLFDYKSMMTSIRDIKYKNKQGVSNIRNHFFYMSEDEVRANCDDPVILEDMKKYPSANTDMLEILAESRADWYPEIKDLFDYCVNFTKRTFNERKNVDYKFSLECWDAGFQQIRNGMMSEKENAELEKLEGIARRRLANDIEKFGFIIDISEEEEVTE